MGGQARKLEADRAVRNSARETFDLRLAQVRQDLEARGVGGRIADKIGQDAREMFEEAVEVADHNRGVVAGTIAALAIWILRNPIVAWLEGLMDADAKEDSHDED
jgi:hypothetical protein